MPYKDGGFGLYMIHASDKSFNHILVYSSYGQRKVKDIQVKGNAEENILTHPYRIGVLGDNFVVFSVLLLILTSVVKWIGCMMDQNLS